MPKAPKPINDTTFEVELFGKDKVEIGDKESTDFKPYIKLNRWDGECFIKVELPTIEKPEPIVEGDKVKFGGKDIEACFYALDPTTVVAKDKDGNDVGFAQNELGGFEFEIVLKKKPAKNEIVLDIETQGLKFYHQPPLTQEEIADGSVRPDNVIGSYSVYHATRMPMHSSQADAEKYKCGKAFHIYRPKVKDAGGKEIWAELNITDSTLTITIDQTWLDSAVYPVSIDPNFGCETKGGTATTLEDYMRLGRFAPTDGDGTGDSITLWIYCDNEDKNVKCNIYDDGDGVADLSTNLIANGATEEILIPSLPIYDNWKTFDFVSAPSLTNGVFYRLAAWGALASGFLYAYYDAEAGQNLYLDSVPYGDWLDPYDGFRWDGFKLSIYCTYSVGAAPQTISSAGAIASAEAFGTPVIAGPITASGIASLEAFGTPQLNLKIEPTSIASVEAFGTAKLSLEISPSGIASSEAFGTAKLNLRIEPTGIASAETFGAAQLNLKLSVTGIASTEAFGTPQLNLTIYPSAIVSTEAFGTAVVTGPITVSGIASVEAIGSHTVTLAAQVIEPSAIGSAEAFGTAQLNLKVIVTGIASTEAFGTAKLILFILPTSITSAEAFGAVQLNLTISPSGIASSEAFGALVVTGPIIVSGIASQEAFGTAIIAGPIIVSSIASAEAFGTAHISALVGASGISSLEAFGVPVIAGPIIVEGIVSAEAFGLTVPSLGIAVFDDTMANLVYELDDREIFNDIRSETIVSEIVDIDDSGWVETTITYSKPASFFAYADSREYMRILDLPSGFIRADVVSVSWLGVHRYTDITTGEEISVECSLSVELDETLARCYVTVPVRIGDPGEWENYDGDLYITYNGREWVEGSHEETVYSTLMVRATDPDSIKKYGRRVMNLTWPMGATQEQSQSLIDSYCGRYSEPVARVLMKLTGGSDFLRAQILTRQISERIRVIESSNLKLDKHFFINRLDFRDSPHELVSLTCTLEELRDSETAGVFLIGEDSIGGTKLIG